MTAALHLADALTIGPATTPRILTEHGARILTDRITAALGAVRDLLIEAYDGRAWDALGYDTWAAYCGAELATLALPASLRREVAADLREQGWSTRAIAAPLHCSDFTVRTDIQKANRPALLGRVRGADGKSYAATAPVFVVQPAAAPPKTDQTVALLLAAGTAGMTVHELCRRTKWHHGSASRVLHALHAQHRAVRVEAYREGCGVYVHPEHA